MSIDWERIENFIGFGRPGAPVVFLGMEEGLRRDADLLADIQARSTYKPYMDLGEAQTQLDGPGAYFGPTPITQNTWRPMCHLMLRRAGNRHPTLEQRRRYQADLLGRRNGDSLLTELLPYPHSDSEQCSMRRSVDIRPVGNTNRPFSRIAEPCFREYLPSIHRS